MLIRELAEIGSFIVIGAGAIGCVVAGLIADRVGRTLVTSWAMAISGTCCLVIGLLYGGNPVVLLLVAAIWGATVVADSAQFSSCVTELGDPQYIGTALTIQMCIGFLLTSVSIELIPKMGNWRYAFMILAPGPLFGVICDVETAAIAGGDENRAWKTLDRISRFTGLTRCIILTSIGDSMKVLCFLKTWLNRA